MILQIILWLFFSSIIYLYIKWCNVKKYWALRNIPHEPPHPVFGSLTFLQKQNPVTWLRRIYAKYRNEPYVGMWLFWRPGLVINDVEVIRRIFLKDSSNFRNRFSTPGKTDGIGFYSLFFVKDPLWGSLRKRLSPAFTAPKLRILQPITSTKASELVERIAYETKTDQRISLRNLYTDYTTDVIGESSLGVPGEVTKTGKGPLREVTDEFTKYNIFRGMGWSCIFFLPDVCDVFGCSLFPKPAVGLLRSTFQTAVEHRGGFNSKDERNRDLLDALLKMKKEASEEGEYMDEDLICAQAAIFLQGGYDTSAVILTYATYELAFQPHLQDRLYQELLEAKKNNGNEPFDSTLLSELLFLNAVLKETLRKYPALSWVDRVAANAYKLDDKLTIPAGSVVYINIIGVHYDPEYYPEPEKFDPDRFLPENEGKIKPFTFMPFGGGPRMCIGEKFAYLTLRHGFANIFLNFSVKPYPDSPPPSECQFEKRAIQVMPEKPLYVQFSARN